MNNFYFSYAYNVISIDIYDKVLLIYKNNKFLSFYIKNINNKNNIK